MEQTSTVSRLRCWRVWFKDGSAVLVNAPNAAGAERAALGVTGNKWYLQRDPKTWPTAGQRIECLDD